MDKKDTSVSRLQGVKPKDGRWLVVGEDKLTHQTTDNVAHDIRVHTFCGLDIKAVRASDSGEWVENRCPECDEEEKARRKANLL
jgi:hypothetical protein